MRFCEMTNAEKQQMWELIKIQIDNGRIYHNNTENQDDECFLELEWMEYVIEYES